MSYMSLEKVRDRIVLWFKSEGGMDDQSNEVNSFVAEQFKNELNPSGMLSVQYSLICQGKPIDLQQLFK